MGAKTVTIAERDGALLRHARGEDLDAVDHLTVEGYRAIQESYVDLVGAETYDAVRHEPQLSWEERKCAQNRQLFDTHPERLWVLEREGEVFGYVTFWLFPEQSYGHIDNNAVDTDAAGQGWATFMYRHVLDHFRELGLRFAHVDTGLDDAHLPARRAYAAVGFDRAVPVVEYWQDLSLRNAGSTPAD
ncbi:MAG: GNAT family N-acetyltransferase [Actinobacteria bacterium]|nr:GNAT family N-acetyltransferase [Actinomycetota bacterium]